MLRYDHLIGRPFAWGSTDCFGLARDFFADNFRIGIRNYARPDSWDAEVVDLIRVLFAREGFVMLTDLPPSELRPGDVACMAIGASRPNHFAIYVGDNEILHHKAMCLSNVEMFRGAYRQFTSFYLRHPNVPDMRPELPVVDIRTLISEKRTFKAGNQTSAVPSEK